MVVLGTDPADDPDDVERVLFAPPGDPGAGRLALQRLAPIRSRCHSTASSAYQTLAIGRAARIAASASTGSQPRSRSTAYPALGPRLMPMWQCVRTTPPAAIASRAQAVMWSNHAPGTRWPASSMPAQR